MKSFNNGVSRGLILAGSATLLAACGGGGGGDTPFVDGEQGNPYVISLRADRTQLPLNLERAWPGLNGYTGVGLESVYTTTLYVNAHRQRTNDVIPEGQFQCNVTPTGLEYGALFYLNGEDEETNGVLSANRNVILGANAGAATFHFHASDQVGTATVTCAIPDPQSGRMLTTQLQINVGGTSSGKAAMVTIEKAHASPQPGTAAVFIHNQNAREIVLTGTVRDESMQPVADSVPMCARIVPFPNSDAHLGTELFSGGGRVPPGEWVQSPTIRGEARFTLRAGTRTGPIGVEIRANRDGQAGNCAGFDIDNLAVVTAIDNLWGENELRVNADLASYYLDQGYLIRPATTPATFDTQGMTVLDTAGTGVPPFAWSIINGALPAGVTLNSDGAIVGTPTAAGETQFTVRVEDGLLSPRRRQDQVVTFGVYTMPTVGGDVALSCAHGQDLVVNQDVNASGGKAPLQLTSGGAPFGLQFAAVTGGAKLIGQIACDNPGTCEDVNGVKTWVTEQKVEVEPVSMTVTDANGVSVTDIVTFTLTTSPEPRPASCQ